MNRGLHFRSLSLSCILGSVIGFHAETAMAQQPNTDAGATPSGAGALQSVAYRKGDIVTFGHYEQDNDPANGKEPISWIVLDQNDQGQYLLLSEKVLDAQVFNDTARVDSKDPRPEFVRVGGYKDGDTTIVISGRSLHDRDLPCNWELSTIRSWLNGYGPAQNFVKNDYTAQNFIDQAFTSEEKAKIVSANVPAHLNPSYPDHSPGNATKDKLFLLSYVEVKTYFGGQFAKADATNYALKRGVRAPYGTVVDRTCKSEHCYASWWLRSPASFDGGTTSVGAEGLVSDAGHGCGYLDIGVRPALWLQL